MFINRLGPTSTAPAGGTQTLFDVPFCGQNDEPGVAVNRPELVDFTDMPTSTPDQLRIEAVLDQMDLSGRAILHVGVGNSQLARRVSSKCRLIDGITVSGRERDLANSLRLGNYQVHRANKYSVTLPAILNKRFDLILDNNLASFACCGFHLLVMFSSYRAMLAPGGSILTDEQGMQWTAGDPRWRMSFADLKSVSEAFQLRASRMTELVYSMTRIS